MGNKLFTDIDLVLDKKVRPALNAHHGDVEVLDLDEDGTLWINLTGECAGCMYADQTTRDLIQKEICAAFPQIKKVDIDNGITDDIIAEALKLMSHR